MSYKTLQRNWQCWCAIMRYGVRYNVDVDVDVWSPIGSQLVLFPPPGVVLLLSSFAERCAVGVQGSWVPISSQSRTSTVWGPLSKIPPKQSLYCWAASGYPLVGMTLAGIGRGDAH